MELTEEERAVIVAMRRKKVTWEPRTLESYTVEEKVAFFDAKYETALRLLHEKEKEGYIDEDVEHYIFESVLELLDGDKGFWSYWNAL